MTLGCAVVSGTETLAAVPLGAWGHQTWIRLVCGCLEGFRSGEFGGRVGPVTSKFSPDYGTLGVLVLFHRGQYCSAFLWDLAKLVDLWSCG